MATTQKTKTKSRKVWRDAHTGKFAKAKSAKKRPARHVRETV